MSSLYEPKKRMKGSLEPLLFLKYMAKEDYSELQGHVMRAQAVSQKLFKEIQSVGKPKTYIRGCTGVLPNRIENGDVEV